MYPNGAYGCFYCGHYAHNPIKKALETGTAQIHNVDGTPGIGVNGCRYPGKDIRRASPFENKQNKKLVMIQRTPCVVSDATIEELAERGVLDQYEVKGRVFDFPTFDQLENNPELEDKYMIRKD